MAGWIERFNDIANDYARVNNRMAVLEHQFVVSAELERSMKEPEGPQLVPEVNPDRMPELYGLTPREADMLVALEQNKRTGRMDHIRLYMAARSVGAIDRGKVDDAIKLVNGIRTHTADPEAMIDMDGHLTKLGSEIATAHRFAVRNELLSDINDLREETRQEYARVSGQLSGQGREQYRQAMIVLDRAESCVMSNSPLIIERNLEEENSLIRDHLNTIRASMAVAGSRVIDPPVLEYSLPGTSHARNQEIGQSMAVAG